MNKQKIFGIVASAIVAVALIVYAAYVLVGVYPDVLLTAQDRNAYSGDALYFGQQIVRPFGLMQYVGGYLTQFFFHPAVGAAMLIAIWAASAFVAIKAFRLKGIWRSLVIVPVACLLASELDLGYWVYCLTLPGYWFSQSVAFLCLLLLLWAATATPRRFRLVWYAVVGFVLFPVLGWMSYLFAVTFALSQFARVEKKWLTPTWIDLVGIVLAVAAPFVFQLLCDAIPSRDVLNAGFPFFRTTTNFSIRPSYPFFVLIGATLVLSLCHMLPALKKIPSWTTSILVGAASGYMVWTTMFHDDNYIYEMQMTQATMNDDWKGVIKVAEQTKTPSRTMVMLKNIALLNSDQLERSFELSNDGVEIVNPDSLNLNIMHIAAPVVYYNFGKMNYSIRWCVEFGVPYGFSPFYLKNLARCAKATGEEALMRRYVNRLHTMKYYSDWKPAETSPIVKEFQSVCSEALTSDDNSCERYLITDISTHHFPKCIHHTEMSLVFAMMVRSPAHFWPAFFDYLSTHSANDIPAIYEQAFCLFMDQAKVDLPFNVYITPTTIKLYREFLSEGNRLAQTGFNEEGVREALRAEFGTSYWWFNAFGRSEY